MTENQFSQQRYRLGKQASLQSSRLDSTIRASPKKSHMIFRSSNLYPFVHLSLRSNLYPFVHLFISHSKECLSLSLRFYAKESTQYLLTTLSRIPSQGTSSDLALSADYDHLSTSPCPQITASITPQASIQMIQLWTPLHSISDLL